MCATACVPEADALRERGVPQVRRVALRPLYATRDLRRAVVDKTLPAVRQYRRRDDSQLFHREGCRWCVRCGRLVGRRVPAVTWRSRLIGDAANGPMVTAATVDASAVLSAGQYCLSPVVSRARCLQAAVQATTPQFIWSDSAPSALLLPLSCTVVVVSSRGPSGSASWPCPGGRAGGAGCGKPCAPKRSGCVFYGFCWRCSGAA